MRTVRINRKATNDVVKNAIALATEEGYEKGFIDGYNLVTAKDKRELLSLMENVLEINQVKVEAEKSAKFNADLLSTNSTNMNAELTRLRGYLATANKENSNLTERLADSTRKLTRYMQSSSSAVGGTLRRRNRKKSKDRAAFVRKESNGYY